MKANVSPHFTKVHVVLFDTPLLLGLVVRGRWRRKALKPLLKELLVRDPYNLPAELLPHILTWVGYDLIHNFPGEYCYQRDELWPQSDSDSESDTAEPYPYGI